MNSHKLLVSTAMIAILLLGLAAGLAAAQAPDGGAASPDAAALGTAFTYQGQLIVNGTPANGACDFRFTLYDAASSGSQVGSAVVKPALPVTGGLFTTDLDFGSGIFTGQKRWLQVEASCPASGSPSYTVVGALQELTATPYALYAASAGGGGGGGWSLTGNAGTTPGANYLGTSDYRALELKVNGARALRIEPNATIPNLIGGYSGNAVTTGAYGATIGGGGASGEVNRVSDVFGTVGGGLRNLAGDGDSTWNDASYATVGGGYGNTASGAVATVGGGESNSASGAVATVGGGGSNQASGASATVGGGNANRASGAGANVGGGDSNQASGEGAALGGGTANTASGDYATLAGGLNNGAGGYASTVGGGDENGAGGDYATVAGGGFSIADAGYATVGGGMGNLASAYVATVGGGANNSAAAQFGTIAGGGSDDPATGNRVTDDYGSVGGGANNQAGDNAGTAADQVYATVAGGESNKASGRFATVGGGDINEASGAGATVGGGTANTASGSSHATVGGGYTNTSRGFASTVGGGYTNTASGSGATVGGGYTNTASGDDATVPGGRLNTASGDYSFAAGYGAAATHQGAFVWGDSTDATVGSSVNNQFVARASGGVIFYTNSAMVIGSYLAAGSGTWSVYSDRALKENFAPVDGRALLDQLAKTPVTTWNYKTQDAAIRHMGPVAQDFYAAFGVGEDDTHITTIDADGVALAASQALYTLAQEQASQIAALQAQNAALEARLAALEARAAAGPAVGAVLTRPGGAQ